MNEKLFETINNLIQTGGNTAIWILAIYFGSVIAKFAIGFGCILAGICKLCKTLLLIFKDKNNGKNTN